MKTRLIMASVLAAALSSLTANACLLQIYVACPNGNTSCGIQVCVQGVGTATTDNLGMASITVPAFGTYTVCVATSTLPAGATLSTTCQTVDVEDAAPPVVDFTLCGDFCTPPPAGGQCWLTGGGTVFKAKGQPNYSFGGVVYPGCSPSAAGGGNWNVVDHFAGLHFQGQNIIVDDCSGVSTKSPKVNVNIIDFHGTGIISGVGGNPSATEPVSFVGRAVDNNEPGGGNDMLYISVTDASNTVVLQIGNSASNPATISTGNLQIHTTSCN
jgi:hypothetical protein